MFVLQALDMYSVGIQLAYSWVGKHTLPLAPALCKFIFDEMQEWSQIIVGLQLVYKVDTCTSM